MTARAYTLAISIPIQSTTVCIHKRWNSSRSDRTSSCFRTRFQLLLPTSYYTSYHRKCPSMILGWGAGGLDARISKYTILCSVSRSLNEFARCDVTRCMRQGGRWGKGVEGSWKSCLSRRTKSDFAGGWYTIDEPRVYRHIL